MAHELPKLDFAYDALEPHIDAKTVEIHHSKHHQGYTNKFNAALEGAPELADMPVEKLLSDLSQIPEGIRTAVVNNGGGFYNHSIYWKCISPNGGGEPTGAIAEKITEAFGSFDQFKEQFETAAKTQFGSGWAWLVKDSEGNLKITATQNQDCPLSEGLTPLLTIDVWEHAYYLNYQNRRPDYITNFWNVINWDFVNSNLV